jgi:hypothetical protein
LRYQRIQQFLRTEVDVKHIHDWAIMPAAGLFAAFILVTTSAAPLADDGEDKRDGRDTISQSTVQQGFAASPIPKDRLKLDGKNPAMVALGSYLVNGPGDCSGCHSLPRFLRPAGTVPVTGNPQHNYTGQGSNPNYGDPFQDPPDQTLTTQLKANYNTAHYLAGGRCFGALQARNLPPDDTGRPRGLTGGIHPSHAHRQGCLLQEGEPADLWRQGGRGLRHPRSARRRCHL